MESRRADRRQSKRSPENTVYGIVGCFSAARMPVTRMVSQAASSRSTLAPAPLSAQREGEARTGAGRLRSAIEGAVAPRERCVRSSAAVISGNAISIPSVTHRGEADSVWEEGELKIEKIMANVKWSNESGASQLRDMNNIHAIRLCECLAVNSVYGSQPALSTAAHAESWDAGARCAGEKRTGRAGDRETLIAGKVARIRECEQCSHSDSGHLRGSDSRPSSAITEKL